MIKINLRYVYKVNSLIDISVVNTEFADKKWRVRSMTVFVAFKLRIFKINKCSFS